MPPPAPLAADETTATRLLTIAEHMFAESGIDAVSLRAITIAADANIAAVHYHFGTKVELVRALVERRVEEVNQARAALLDAIGEHDPVDARTVAHVWVAPLAALARSSKHRAYLGFLVALRNAGPAMRAMASDVFRPHYARLDALAARALPAVAPATRRFRFTLMAEIAIRALADLDAARAPYANEGRPITDEALVAELVDALTGLLEGPTPTRRHP